VHNARLEEKLQEIAETGRLPGRGDYDSRPAGSPVPAALLPLVAGRRQRRWF